MMKLLTFIASLFLLTPVYAAVPHWEILPHESSITFTAIQNGSPVAGQFGNFSGEINFDPDDLSNSKVKITVDMASVSTSYKDVQNTLKTPEWFNVKLFPHAIFQTTQFVKMGNNTFKAQGTLTIRDKTIPIILLFSLSEYNATRAKANGSTVLKRTSFGVGSGEWAKTDEIKDDVKVEFTLSATKQSAT